MNSHYNLKVRNANITFSCLSDPDQAKTEISQLGVADDKDDLLKGKGFVEMTSIDPETSKDFNELISRKGGIYLEAMVSCQYYEIQRSIYEKILVGYLKKFANVISLKYFLRSWGFKLTVMIQKIVVHSN